MPDIKDLPLPEFDFADPKILADPFAAARELSTEHWIARTPTGYILLRYAECAEVSRNKKFRTPAALGLDAQGITGGLAHEWAQENLLGLDGTDHARVRRLAASAFSARAAEQNMRPFAQQLIRELTADFEKPGFGLLETLTNPYAVRIVCHLLGFPDGDWPKVARWADKINQIISVMVTTLIPDIEQAIRELDEYTLEQIERLRSNPDSTLGSTLVQAEEAGDKLTNHELVRLFESLLMAGSHSVQLQIALGLLQFVKRPEDWQAIGANPALAEAATEEVLRFRVPIIGSMRQAREDVTLRDLDIPAGTMFTVAVPSANFDGGVYANPSIFDVNRYVDRTNAATPHLSFGGGAHGCIGMHLARVELSEAFGYLAQRLPNLRVDDQDPIGVEWSHPYGIHGPIRTPLRWDAPPA